MDGFVSVLVLVIEIILCLFSLFMIAVVLLQSGKSAGLSGDIAGGAETFLGKGKGKSYEGRLKKLTKVAAVGIMVLAIALVLIQVYAMPSAADTTEVAPSATPTAQVSDQSDDAAATQSAADVESTPTASPAE
jgi:preprotein translocase subunit SecG